MRTARSRTMPNTIRLGRRVADAGGAAERAIGMTITGGAEIAVGMTTGVAAIAAGIATIQEA